MSEATPAASAYPVTYDVEPQLHDRNRKTCALRIIYAIPHLVIVGGGFSPIGWLFAAVLFSNGSGRAGGGSSFGAEGGLGAVAVTMAVVAWFAIMFAKTHPRGLWDFATYYLRWKSKVNAYASLLRDDYPPFGEGDYPVTFTVAEMPADASRRGIGWRLLTIIPHIVVLAALGIVWAVLSFVAWLSIVFTGSYPEGLYKFSVGYLRWTTRVESYVLLVHDEYPPFSFD